MSLGESRAKPDAADKLTGTAPYAQDLRPADVLEAKVVFSNEPHARLRSIDTSEAEAIDGVVAVLTAADVPVNEYGLTMADQPVLVGPDHSGRSAGPAARPE